MSIIEDVEGLVSHKLAALAALWALMKKEAQLAGLSLAPLMLSLFGLVLMIMTGWSLTLVLIGYCIALVAKSAFIAILLVFVLNLGMFFVFMKYLILNIRNITFEKTRAYFSKERSEDDGFPTPSDRRTGTNKPTLNLPR